MLPERILYESDTLRVRYLGFADSPVCVVTFAHFSPSPRTRRRGFGEPFFLKHRISAVHVTCSGNDWYQYPDVGEIGRAVAPLRERYGRIVTYGSSMGGYAAILFAADCGADAAIAASPQFSIDPRKIPYDTVRARDGARIRMLRDELRVGDGTKVYLIYDDLIVDRTHAEDISRHVAAEHLVARGAGHPALKLLARARLLGPTVLGLVRGTADTDALRHSFRRVRRFSASYFRHLAGRTQREDRQITLLREARKLDPTRMDAYAMEARIHVRQGAFAEAEAVFLAALEARPEHAVTMAQYAHLLTRMGRAEEALRLASAAAAVAPDSPQVRKILEHCERSVPGLPAGTEPAPQHTRPGDGPGLPGWAGSIRSPAA